MEKRRNSKGMKYAILSMSLLTVMAGAAVAPALGAISAHFSNASGTLVQMIISMPSLFIFLSSFIFPKLCQRFGSRTLVMIGLAFYVIGGCGAAFFDNIYIVLIFRALVGVGVGFIMPLSTGLLSYYYPPQELDGLMGLSSAMNQLGGAIATFIAGLLATVSWSAVFMVYLMGLISVVLCLLFLPNDRIAGNKDEKASHANSADGSESTNNSGSTDNSQTPDSTIKGANAVKTGGAAASDVNAANNTAGSTGNASSDSALKKYFVYVAAMFVLMSTFFVYPSNYALEAAKDGVLSQQAIATIMALMDVIAFAGGLSFVTIKGKLKANAHFAAPALFFAGYVILAATHGVIGSVAGSFLVGFANGAGIPCIIASASKKAGREAVSTVMPLISAAMYMGQFLAPFIMSAVTALFGGVIAHHLPFWFAAVLAVLLAMIAVKLRNAERGANS